MKIAALSRRTRLTLPLALMALGAAPLWAGSTAADAAENSSISAPLGRSAAIETDLAAGHAVAARLKSLEWAHAEPRSADAWTWVGRAYLAEGRNRRAVRAFNRALKWSPHNARAFWGRGQAFEKRGRLDEAANEYRAAVLADPHLADAQSALSRLKDQASLPE
ncbi:MAG: tetratricopeptide repeat protein [Elusimicrobia bacterium]|nr:tetratricopeptide repeat protein [Elusimicrobiota bacterium]